MSKLQAQNLNQLGCPINKHIKQQLKPELQRALIRQIWRQIGSLLEDQRKYRLRSHMFMSFYMGE